jgi:type IV pilus assembly protein PilP
MGYSDTNHLQTRQRSFSVGRTLAIIASCAVLASCVGADHSDLQVYVNNVIASQKPKIEPLPEFKPYPIYVYEAGELRDPFEESAFVQQQAEVAIEGSGMPRSQLKEAVYAHLSVTRKSRWKTIHSTH